MDNIRNIKYSKKDNGLLCSLENIYIPFLNTSLEIWCNTFNKEFIPIKCFTVLKTFVKNDFRMTEYLINGLNNYCKKLVAENRIVKKSKKINIINEVKFTNVILPYQNRTKDRFILLYGDTSWKIKNSKNIIELEILFKNNKIETIQESTGLWTRIEWEYFYNIKEKK